MTASSILVLLLIAFVGARLFRSTKMWWAFMSAIMAGLLMGMLSKEVVASTEATTETTLSISTDDKNDTTGMQSLVSAVTEGTTVANLGLQVTVDVINNLSGALVESHPLKGRDSPSINDSS